MFFLAARAMASALACCLAASADAFSTRCFMLHPMPKIGKSPMPCQLPWQARASQAPPDTMLQKPGLGHARSLCPGMIIKSTVTMHVLVMLHAQSNLAGLTLVMAEVSFLRYWQEHRHIVLLTSHAHMATWLACCLAASICRRDEVFREGGKGGGWQSCQLSSVEEDGENDMGGLRSLTCCINYK